MEEFIANTAPKAARPTTTAMPGLPTSRQRLIAIRAGMAVSTALQNCTADTPGGALLPQLRRRAGAEAWMIP